MALKIFEFDLKLEKGPILKPYTFELNSHPNKESKHGKPLKYYADVLTALSFYNINKTMNKPNAFDLENTIEVWRQVEASYEMYGRSRKRVLALHEQTHQQNPELIENFEKKFDSCLAEIWHKDKVNLKDLYLVNDLIDYLEDQMKTPLLFNFSLSFSPEFQQKLLFLYSFLWNIRSLVAIDHNSYVEDSSHESLKMDSITDYLPKAEYIVNDALNYFQFKKLFIPFVSGRSSDVKIEKLLFEPMYKSFHQYSHNACHLIDHLPENFLSNLSPKELEEALYLVQMDWLLGSEAGLLFKIREEIFGIQEGYEKIFWHEYDFRDHQHSVKLNVCCELSSKHFQKRIA
ncbi:MAG: hypothetical protein L6Q37_02710 [Bdellovibrionaceae bacterium]|nr:hypothetical protein [Pseudobdellovibrionaceae bacterium]NUM58039.1 hypothetical protein [Pseudobdellovibrionaceae bacterium]